jgi:hypothetical protein
MNQHVDWKRLQNVEDVIRGGRRNTSCLFSGCGGRPIGSHVIARKMLELIADEGHVLTWLPRQITAWDMMRSIREGRSIEQLYEDPIRVGIGDRNRVTEPLFCSDHDTSIFAPLEREDFSFQPQQVALLAYRALCSMVLSTASIEAILAAVTQQHDKHGLTGSLRTLRKLQRFQQTELILQVRQLYEQIQAAKNYNLLDWSMYLVNIPPCIAATYSLTPYEANEDKDIANGKLAVTAADAVCFSFLPYKPQESSICVISWLNESKRAMRFMTYHRINEISEKEQLDLFLFFAFESPTLYISPTWWQSLSDGAREKYQRIRLDADRRHNQLD